MLVCKDVSADPDCHVPGWNGYNWNDDNIQFFVVFYDLYESRFLSAWRKRQRLVEGLFDCPLSWVGVSCDYI